MHYMTVNNCLGSIITKTSLNIQKVDNYSHQKTLCLSESYFFQLFQLFSLLSLETNSKKRSDKYAITTNSAAVSPLNNLFQKTVH